MYLFFRKDELLKAHGWFGPEKGGTHAKHAKTSLTDAQLRAGLDADAMPFRKLDYSEQAWLDEFGTDGIVETPDGPVKMGENQHLKLRERGRIAEFGLIKPTLRTPSLIVEIPKPEEGADRQTAKLYIKGFIGEDKNRYFLSLTVLRGDVEVSVTSHLKRIAQLGRLVRSGEQRYSASAFAGAVTPGRQLPTAQAQPDGASNQSIEQKTGKATKQRPLAKAASDPSVLIGAEFKALSQESHIPVLFFKSTSMKTITVPGYTRHDGTYVSAHQKTVHVDADDGMGRDGRQEPIDNRLTALLSLYAEDGPSAEKDIREAVRQYREVERQNAEVVRAHREGGKPLPAPNGQPSNLNEEQWILVRTPNFKRWFGDWEAIEVRARIMSSQESTATTSGLTESGDYRTLRTEAKALYRGPAVVTNAETHQAIRVEASGIENALQHGMNIEKRAVLSVLDEMLENAVFVVRDTQNMKPGVRSVETFAARVAVDGKPFIARMVVREVEDGRRFYDHEISSLTPESARPTSNSGGSEGASANRQSQPRPLVSLGKRLVDEAVSVNQNTVSQVVTENGEPLVVYHGTSSDFDAFDQKKIGTNYRQDRRGFFFSGSPREAEWAAGDAAEKAGAENIVPVFLRIQSPQEISANRPGFSASGYLDNNKKVILDRARLAKSDGLIVRSGGDVVYVAFSPPQIKSAIGNRGTYSAKDKHMNKSQPLVLFFKSTSMKTITVPGYTRHDGTYVPPHQKKVHYDPDKAASDLSDQKGTHRILGFLDVGAQLCWPGKSLSATSSGCQGGRQPIGWRDVSTLPIAVA